MDTESEAGLWGGLPPVVHRRELAQELRPVQPCIDLGLGASRLRGTPVPLAVPPTPGFWKLLWESTALGRGVRTTGGLGEGVGKRATLLDTPGPTTCDPRLGFPRPRPVRTAWSLEVTLPSAPSSVPAWRLCP